VDTTGLLIRVVAHSADFLDRDGAFLLLSAAYLFCARLKLIWADMGYRGERLKEWIEGECGWRMEIVKRPRKMGLVPGGC
jgi:transposase